MKRQLKDSEEILENSKKEILSVIRGNEREGVTPSHFLLFNDEELGSVFINCLISSICVWQGKENILRILNQNKTLN